MLDVSRLFSLWFVLSVSVSLTLLQCALAGGKQRNAHRWNGRADETRALRADESAARKATAECAGEPQASSAVAYCVVRGLAVLDVSRRFSVSFVFSVSVSPSCNAHSQLSSAAFPSKVRCCGPVRSRFLFQLQLALPRLADCMPAESGRSEHFWGTPASDFAPYVSVDTINNF